MYKSKLLVIDHLSVLSVCIFFLRGWGGVWFRQLLTIRWPGEEIRNKGESIWRLLTLCDSNYTMKARPDVEVTYSKLKSSS